MKALNETTISALISDFENSTAFYHEDVKIALINSVIMNCNRKGLDITLFDLEPQGDCESIAYPFEVEFQGCETSDTVSIVSDSFTGEIQLVINGVESKWCSQ